MKEDKFNFSDIFSKSFKEYKDNFKESLKFLLLFAGLPALIFLIVEVVLLIVDQNLFLAMTSALSSSALLGDVVKTPLYYRLITYFFTLVSIFFMVFVSAGFISTSLKKEKFSFIDLVKNAKARYWQYFVFSIVLIIFIILLMLLLIIPGLIFGVYWIFASYIFFDKKLKIMDSLKESRMIVKHRWWKTFGYFLLVGLIIAGFAILFSLIQMPFALIISMHVLNSTPISLALLIAYTIVGSIVSFLITLVSTPLPIIFLKNFYRKMEVSKTQVKKVNKGKK